MVQPDDIIPDQYNPQDWDRYAYVRNNPINFNDPSGHSVDCGMGDSDCHRGKFSPKRYLAERRDWIKKEVDEGNISSDLEGFAQLAEYGASLTPDCSSCFVENMGAVLTGDDNGYAWVQEVEAQLGYASRSPYYRNGPEYELQQGGFAFAFQDPAEGRNQPHHYWFYVQMGFQERQKASPDMAFPLGAVLAHEVFLAHDRNGMSFQDVALGVEGVRLGDNLSTGAVKLADVGNYIRNTLPNNSPNANFWTRAYLYYSLSSAAVNQAFFR